MEFGKHPLRSDVQIVPIEMTIAYTGSSQDDDSLLLHVVIPAYGQSEFLDFAIKSVISAVSLTTLITVLDDASITNDSEIITSRFAGRVEFIQNESNFGLAANFRKSFTISRGKFTVVMGSDDQMLPGYEDSLKRAVNNFPNAKVIHPNVGVINSEGILVLPFLDRIKRVIRGNASEDQLMDNTTFRYKLLIGNFMYFPATAWHTQTLNTANWVTSYKHAVDMDLLFKLAASESSFVFTSAQTFNYRRRADSVSSVLAQEDTRLREELAVHWMVRNLLGDSTTKFTRILVQLAPTIRIHALIIGLKQLPRNPLKGIRHICRALSPIKPVV